MKTPEEILKDQFAKYEYEEILQNLGFDITPSLVKAMELYADLKTKDLEETIDLMRYPF